MSVKQVVETPMSTQPTKALASSTGSHIITVEASSMLLHKRRHHCREFDSCAKDSTCSRVGVLVALRRLHRGTRSTTRGVHVSPLLLPRVPGSSRRRFWLMIRRLQSHMPVCKALKLGMYLHSKFRRHSGLARWCVALVDTDTSHSACDREEQTVIRRAVKVIRLSQKTP